MKIYGLLMWSFFSGVIVASVIILFQRYRVVNLYQIGYVFLGIVSAVAISSFPALNFSANYAVIFLAGAIAFCAMILPGISGAFILLIMGTYSTILLAINDKDFLKIATFGFGALVGILYFSKILKILIIYFLDQVK